MLMRDVMKKHELVDQADSVWPHPTGDSSGKPKYALWDQPSKPLTHCDSLPFFSVSLQQYNYTHCRPQEHSLCRKGNNTIQCCFPCCTCDNGMEKYWHWRRQRSGRNTFVRWCYMLAQALLSGNGAKEERDSESELHGAGWDLGHSRDFLMGCGWSDSWCKNLYPATTKLNRQKQTAYSQIE